MKFFNFKNSHTNDNIIYSKKDIADMSVRDAFKNKEAIMAQHNAIGVPSESELQASPNAVYVHAYTRDDGTEVRAHWRSLPDGNPDSSAVSSSIHNEEQDIKENKNGTITGMATSINNDNSIDDIVNCVNNILDNKKSNSIKELEDNIMLSNEYFDKPDYYTPFIINNALIAFNESKNKMNLDAKELMNIALSGKEFLPGNSLEYNTLDKGSGKEINEKYNLNGTNKYIPDSYFGVEFALYSSLSKNLSNSKKLQEQIRAQYDSKAGKFKTEKIEIDLMNDDKNLAYSIGHCTILDPKILPDGTFSGKVFDKYDYEWHEPDGTKTTDLNNKAYILQKAGILHNYYIIAPIKFKL